MSRNSRIHHPPAGIFIQIQQWIVKAYGMPAAAVVGLLDFLDQGQDEPMQPLASRQQIVAYLEGLVGRNNVDRSLAELVERGWVKKIERVEVQKNLVYWHDFALNSAKINEAIEAGIPGVPKSGCRVSLYRDRNRDRNRGPDRDVNKTDIKEDKEKEQLAAAEKHKHPNPSVAPPGAADCGTSAPLERRGIGGLDAKLLELRLYAEQIGGNEGLDKRNLSDLRNLADLLGEDGPQLVLAAISGEHLPAAARRAAEAGGLFDLARQRSAERNAEAAEGRVAEQRAAAEKVVRDEMTRTTFNILPRRRRGAAA